MIRHRGQGHINFTFLGPTCVWHMVSLQQYLFLFPKAIQSPPTPQIGHWNSVLSFSWSLEDQEPHKCHCSFQDLQKLPSLYFHLRKCYSVWQIKCVLFWPNYATNGGFYTIPETPISWGENECLHCLMFDPDFLKSPQVKFYWYQQRLDDNQVSWDSGSDRGDGVKELSSCSSSFKELAWPKHCLDDSLISPFGRVPEPCLPTSLSFWRSFQCTMQEVRSWLFSPFGWRLSPVAAKVYQ